MYRIKWLLCNTDGQTSHLIYRVLQKYVHPMDRHILAVDSMLLTPIEEIRAAENKN
jgi:hypothetical protein